MYQGLLVIDADAHKPEKSPSAAGISEPQYRDRIGLVIDCLGDQRARIVDFNPATGKNDLCGCLNRRLVKVAELESRYDQGCSIASD